MKTLFIHMWQAAIDSPFVSHKFICYILVPEMLVSGGIAFGR